jgi:colanic acid biosynthesis glycosyl transferase WcaI
MSSILIHDYGAYAFPLDLSIELGRRGHAVMHLYHVDTKQPRSHVTAASCPNVVVSEVSYPYDKYSLATKPYNDYQYGLKVRQRIESFKPRIVISSNTPLNAQSVIQKASGDLGAMFVYWLQDVISEGIRVALSQRSRAIANLSRLAFGLFEGRLLRQSDFVVAASPDFASALNAFGVRPERVKVIENWAPLSDCRATTQSNEWSRAHGFAGEKCVVYSGTLGLKHDPRLFFETAQLLSKVPGVRFVIVSEGPGAEWLKREFASARLSPAVVLPLQPYAEIPNILATASVLLSVVSADASRFCFPSKTLTYLCANRPVVLAAPPHSNLARKLQVAGAALVVSPNAPSGIADAILRLLDDCQLSHQFAAGASNYARSEFDVSAVADQFESVFSARHASPCNSRKPMASLHE